MSEFPECKKFTHSVFHLHVLSTPHWELSTSNPASKGCSGELGRVIFKSKLPERNMEMRSSHWQEFIARLTYHTLRDIQQILQHVNTWATDDWEWLIKCNNMPPVSACVDINVQETMALLAFLFKHVGIVDSDNNDVKETWSLSCGVHPVWPSRHIWCGNFCGWLMRHFST